MFTAPLVSMFGNAQQLAHSSATDASTNPPYSLQPIIDRNTLAGKGKLPFMLKVQFQIFDLNQKSGEQGTLTYWWAGPKGTALSITSPGLEDVHSLEMNAKQPPQHRRELYLLSTLLNDLVTPAAGLRSGNVTADLKAVRVGSVDLRCATVAPSPHLEANAKICLDDRDTVRESTDGIQDAIRNHVGVFAGTRVALEVYDFINGMKTVSGRVDTLRSFDPADPAVKLDAPPNGDAGGAQAPVPVLVKAGKKIGGEQPKYPSQAKLRHISGTVLMSADITKEGKIAYLVPISSPDESLTKAAMDAVSTWTYQPYLLNGTPTDVMTTLAVNFQFN